MIDLTSAYFCKNSFNLNVVLFCVMFVYVVVNYYLPVIMPYLKQGKTGLTKLYSYLLLGMKVGWYVFSIKVLKRNPIQEKVQDTLKIIPRTKYSNIIEYTLNRKTYRFIAFTKRGPSNIAVIKSGDTDITEEIVPYLGPNEDLHNIRYTPNTFGYETMEIFLVDGTHIVFNGTEEIRI